MPSATDACAATAGAGAPVPDADVTAAATKAQTARLTVERGSHVAYDAAYNEGLYRPATATGHHRHMLIEETLALVHLNSVAAAFTHVRNSIQHLLRQTYSATADRKGTPSSRNVQERAWKSGQKMSNILETSPERGQYCTLLPRSPNVFWVLSCFFVTLHPER